MTPETAFRRLICSVLLGSLLGIFYDFLKPPGNRHRVLADAVFSLAALWVWIYICFAVCRGDIRTVYLMGMFSGILLWEKSFGTSIQPLFSRFWRFFGVLMGFFLIPWKKILKIAKILFASAKKWVTIENTKICKTCQKRRKDTHGPEKHPAKKRESGSSSCIQYP